MTLKLRIARAQLGTALDLFIRDMDPYSVHSLACSGGEIVDGLANEAHLPSFSSHILGTVPGIDVRSLKRIRNQHWNALKHFYAGGQKNARDDEGLMATFEDRMNDAILFAGWSDYLLITKKLPIEAQVFQVWWYATNPAAMNPDVDPSPWQSLFPDIDNRPRREQKKIFRHAIEMWRSNKDILEDPRTELGPLCRAAQH